MLECANTSVCHIRLCIDRYDQGDASGKFCFSGSDSTPCGFLSLTDFFIQAEIRMAEAGVSSVEPSHPRFTPGTSNTSAPPPLLGAVQTFDIRVVSREHASWQGIVRWEEGDCEAIFRSELDLLMLLDSIKPVF